MLSNRVTTQRTLNTCVYCTCTGDPTDLAPIAIKLGSEPRSAGAESECEKKSCTTITSAIVTEIELTLVPSGDKRCHFRQSNVCKPGLQRPTSPSTYASTAPHPLHMPLQHLHQKEKM